MKSFLLLFVLAALVANSFCLKNEICGLPRKAGNCLARVPSWVYEGGLCVTFNYGGCGGNANRFDTQSSCEEKCKE